MTPPMKPAVLGGSFCASAAQNSQGIPGGLEFCFVDTRTCRPLGSVALGTRVVSSRCHTLPGGSVRLVLHSRLPALPPVVSRGVWGGRPAGVVVVTGAVPWGGGVPQRRMLPASRPRVSSRTGAIRQRAGMCWFPSTRISGLPAAVGGTGASMCRPPFRPSGPSAEPLQRAGGWMGQGGL